jgi:hypothetical protein
MAPLPLPRDEVRDLLAITRALYRAELRRTSPGPDPARLDRLAEIGSWFRRALALAKSAPDTLRARAAWEWAEKATAALGEIVTEDVRLAPAVRATSLPLGRDR